MNEVMVESLWADANARTVIVCTLLLNSAAALIGCFTYLQKKSLTGDAVSHSILPGIAIAFLFSGVKDLWVILPGAFLTGGLSLLCIEYILRHSKLKQDTAIALVLSVFFAVGVVLLSYIQHHGNGNQSGLDSFLLGKAAALLSADIPLYFSVAFVVVFSVLLFYRPFMLISFDRSFALSIGMAAHRWQQVMVVLSVLAIVIGIQAVGVVLMSAMLITPAVAARYWSHRLPVVLLLAVLFNMIASVMGIIISYKYPSMPTGPWIVVCISSIAVLSFFIGNAKGILRRSSLTVQK